MSRQETIPDDVRAAAAHALQADSYHPELVFLIEPVALVILAERERCAKLVESYRSGDEPDDPQQAIADGIRTGEGS